VAGSAPRSSALLMPTSVARPAAGSVGE
jgi:hypothetical protein